jgi:hypothetical protein
MMAYWDADRRNVAADTAFLAWLGAPADTVRGMHMLDLLGDRRYAEIEAYVDEVLDGFPQLFEWCLSDGSGGALPMIVSYTPSVACGRIEGFFAVMTDMASSMDGAAARWRRPRSGVAVTALTAEPARPNPCLSLPQELKQVLDLLFQGQSDREIAQSLHLAEETVQRYRSSLLSR